ncbi:hypothetical protein H2201_002392 [Coniosporium apollinis]|uniref:Uncharacterized protein n=1 Tax=Coniosporium apollinis TaxID=61459 RepID=A0ABQ9P3U2_9PEZI|nr:hypothetical protein H2201_002392 [Coniosporium apollinis]
MPTTILSLHRKHGPLVRTGPSELSVADLSAIKKIYGPGYQVPQDRLHSVWQGHRKFNLFAERDEGVHASQRRLVSRAYAMESLRDLEAYVEESAKVFLGKMGEGVDGGNGGGFGESGALVCVW